MKVWCGLLHFLCSLVGHPLKLKTLASYSLNSGQLTWRDSAEVWPSLSFPQLGRHWLEQTRLEPISAILWSITAASLYQRLNSLSSSLASSLLPGSYHSSVSGCIMASSDQLQIHSECESEVERTTAWYAGAQRNDLNMQAVVDFFIIAMALLITYKWFIYQLQLKFVNIKFYQLRNRLEVFETSKIQNGTIHKWNISSRRYNFKNLNLIRFEILDHSTASP